MSIRKYKRISFDPLVYDWVELPSCGTVVYIKGVYVPRRFTEQVQKRLETLKKYDYDNEIEPPQVYVLNHTDVKGVKLLHMSQWLTEACKKIKRYLPYCVTFTPRPVIDKSWLNGDLDSLSPLSRTFMITNDIVWQIRESKDRDLENLLSYVLESEIERSFSDYLSHLQNLVRNKYPICYHHLITNVGHTDNPSTKDAMRILALDPLEDK